MAARDTKLSPFRLKQGAWAKGPGEVVIDAGTADKQHLHIGDSARIATAGPVRSFRVTGITTFGSVDSLGTATIAVFDLHAAQGLFDKAGRVDAILVEAAGGTSAAQVRRNLAAALPQAKVQTAAKQDRFTLDGLKGFISIIRGVLLGFGGVALLVGAFTIFNSLSIMVAQRSREFGLLRLAGASRRQVLRTVVVEALAMGAGASAVGLAAGFGLAKGINALFKALGLDLPQTGTVFASRTIIVSLLVGVLVTLVAGLVPAWRATRVAPVEALRDASGSSRRLRLPARIVRAVVGALGRPVQATGGPAAMLARRNAMRAPGRTAITASALTIGVALVAALTIIAAGLKDSTRGSLEKRVSATHVLAGDDGWSPVDGDAARKAAAVPGVRTASTIRQDAVRAYGKTEGINSVDPATIGKVLDFKWKHGSRATLAALDADGAILDDGWAKKHHLAVGGRFTVITPADKRLTLTVRGIEASPVIDALGLGPITIGTPAYAAGGFSGRQDHLTLLDAPTADPAALQRAVDLVPGRQGVHQARLHRQADQRHQPAAGPLRRAAGAGRDRQPLRAGQHARAGHLRAHPRDRDAARGGHDAPPGPAHGAAREHHHRAAGVLDGDRGRHRAGGHRRGGLRPPRVHVRPADRRSRRARPRRHRGRHAGGDAARAAGGADGRPGSARLRVSPLRVERRSYPVRTGEDRRSTRPGPRRPGRPA